MIGDLFLGLFNSFIDMIGGLFSSVDFTVDYNTLGSAVHYIRMALWFLPVTDILLILGIKIVLVNYMTLVRLFCFIRNLFR